MNPETNTNKTAKRWFVATVAIALCLLLMCAGVTYYIDPFFHYHRPLEQFQYPIDNERYQNRGLTRFSEYDSLITGTSMTSNFKTSQCEELFGGHFAKFSFLGGRFKEVDDNLRYAYDTGHEIKTVIRCLDYEYFVADKDAQFEDVIYPTYLYNDNVFDDVNYLCNITVFLRNVIGVFKYTNEGNTTPDFDEISNWNWMYEFGRDAVMATYNVRERVATERQVSKEDLDTMYASLQQNYFEIIDQHPETQFYIFFPPYSICDWDELDSKGEINWRIDLEKLVIEELFKHPNVRVYSNCTDYDIITNLDNYKDIKHYGEWVNEKILEDISTGKSELTQDNYQQYLDEIRAYYTSYDYESLHEQ